MTTSDPHGNPGNSPASTVEQVAAEIQQMHTQQQAHQQAAQQQLAALKQELSTIQDTFKQELSTLKQTLKTMRASAGYTPPTKGALKTPGQGSK
ncbi:MAG: hypothetical protein AAFQ98_16505 [Bacteroidota bacterium]